MYPAPNSTTPGSVCDVLEKQLRAWALNLNDKLSRVELAEQVSVTKCASQIDVKC